MSRYVMIGCDDTPDWRGTSPLARAIHLEITRKVNERGEIPLGFQGLRGLVDLLGFERFVTWEVFEAELRFLLDHGKLVHDETRRVLLDPQHVQRQDAARAWLVGDIVEVPVLSADGARALSMSPDAVRARARRAMGKACAKPATAAGSTQGSLTFMATPVATMVATAVATGVDTPSRDPDPPDPKKYKSRIRKDPPRARVEHNPDRPDPWAIASWQELRPDLSEYVVRRMWRRFALLEHTSEQDAEDHFRRWLRREHGEEVGSAATLASDAPEPAEPTHEVTEATETRCEPTSRDDAPMPWRPTLVLPDDMPIESRRAIQRAALLEFDEPPEPRSMSA